MKVIQQRYRTLLPQRQFFYIQHKSLEFPTNLHLKVRQCKRVIKIILFIKWKTYKSNKPNRKVMLCKLFNSIFCFVVFYKFLISVAKTTLNFQSKKLLSNRIFLYMYPFIIYYYTSVSSKNLQEMHFLSFFFLILQLIPSIQPKLPAHN